MFAQKGVLSGTRKVHAHKNNRFHSTWRIPPILCTCYDRRFPTIFVYRYLLIAKTGDSLPSRLDSCRVFRIVFSVIDNKANTHQITWFDSNYYDI